MSNTIYGSPGPGGIVTIERGKTYVFTSPPRWEHEGKTYPYGFKFEGNWYYWHGGRFYDMNWMPVDLPVKFVIDPWMHIGSSVQGRPQPVWSCCQHSAGADPGVMCYHTDQMRLIQVCAYLARNTSLEIPLKDSDDVPYLGPEVPPLIVLRWDCYSNADRIGSITTTTGLSDRYTGCKPTGAVSSATLGYAMYYELYLEKEPAPHWVLRLHSAYNGSAAADNRTFHVACVGQMVGDHAASSVEVGSSGTPGHYKVERLFTGATWGDDTNVTTYNQRRGLTHHGYVAASSTGAFYLTDTGAVGGNNLFSASHVPAVRVLGHSILSAAPGVTRTAWEPTSHGLGFRYPVTTYGDPPIATAGQDYHFHSEIAPVTGKWCVQVQNRSSTFARTYFIFAFGRRA